MTYHTSWNSAQRRAAAHSHPGGAGRHLTTITADNQEGIKMIANYEPGARVKQISGSRRTGTITQGIWSGYVTVLWDSGREESGVHIADIRMEAES